MRVRSVLFASFLGLTGPAYAEESAAADQCQGQNPYFPLLAGGSWAYKTYTEVPGEGTSEATVVRSFSLRGPETDAPFAGVMMTRLEVPGATMTFRDEYSLLGGAVMARFLGGEMSVQGFRVEYSPGPVGVLLPPVPALAKGVVWKSKAAASAAFGAAGAEFTASASTDYSADARRSETIVTAAGRFRALKVEGVSEGAVEEVEPIVGKSHASESSWYAPGVGLVKSVAVAGEARQTTELQSFDLPSCCAFIVLEAEGAATSAGAPLAAGDTLSASAGLKVAAGGRLELGKANGLSVTLYEGEHGLSLDCPDATAGIFETIIGKARYWNAKFWSSGRPDPTSGAGYERQKQGDRFGEVWETNTAVVGDRGTIFTIESVRTKRGYKTIVEVEDGEVELKGRDGARVLRLKAGERGEI